ASGTKIAMMATTQMSVVATGCCMDQACEVGGMPPVLPNSSRVAATTAETGFHSAKTFSTVGRFSIGTKVLARKVSGNITMKLALLNTSGERTSRPTTAMIHDSE